MVKPIWLQFRVIDLMSAPAMLLMIVASLASVALLVMLLIVIHNVRYFPHLLSPADEHANPLPLLLLYPPVSILIPARNEAANISATIQALLAQAYPTVEIIVLDDHSTDGTAPAATRAAGGDPRFRLIMGAALPVGWSGKNWACHQLAKVARYEMLLFTDADVHWQPNALGAIMTLQQVTQADLLSVWPTQITRSWGERLVVPLMSFALLAYLPIRLAHHTAYPVAAAANGQCLLFQRRAYLACGGHAAVRGHVLEDVLLAQRTKAKGGQLRMADGAGLIFCHMYHSGIEAISGYAKNILAGHGSSPFLLLLSTLFHLTLFVAPWLWLIIGNNFQSQAGWHMGWPWWPLLLILAGILVRGMTAYSSGQRIYDSLWMPLSVLLMSWIAIQALWWQVRYGGPQWKGRTLDAR